MIGAMMRQLFFFFWGLLSFGSVFATVDRPPPQIQVVTSLSCNHCKDLADKIKNILEKLIGEGLITAHDVDYVDYPGDLATLTATKLSWAKGTHQRYELYRAFLERQDEWHQKDWRDQLKKIAFELGLDEKTIRRCFEDDTEDERAIVSRMQSIFKKYNLEYVPVFIVKGKGIVEVDEQLLRKALESIKHNDPKEAHPLQKTSKAKIPPRIIEKSPTSPT